MISEKYGGFIKEKAEVADSDRTKTFGKGERRQDFEAMWSETGNLILVGLPGSGRSALGERLSARLKRPLLAVDDADALKKSMSATDTIMIVAETLFDDDRTIESIGRIGKVFYLMVDARTLASRMAERSPEDGMDRLWRESADRLERMEPRFMRALHFVVQAGSSPESMVQDVLEKVDW